MTDARQPSSRDERLKAALRDNLRRRKAQARSRSERDQNAPTGQTREQDEKTPGER